MNDLTTEIIQPTDAGISQVAELWRSGGLVAFPTETVYGLAADARNDLAVARIFDAKGRPSFNPLIVHLDCIETAKSYVSWSNTAELLARTFWPGPMTLVLPLRQDARVSHLVTAGLQSLAIRVPAHPIAQRLLSEFGGPVAAPSANRSGKISPTTAAHVAATLDGRIEAILDGGTCAVGLESTIIGLQSDTAALLRPGGLDITEVNRLLPTPLVLPQQGSAISAPGQLLSHYAPGADVRLNADAVQEGEVLLGFGPVADATLNLSQSGNLLEAASNLFAHLHALDAMSPKGIAVSRIPEEGLGIAINDRLRRAAAPRNAPIYHQA